MKLKWHGHSCFELNYADGTAIITDPFDASVGYPVCTARADVVTMSHCHHDHNHIEAIAGDPVPVTDAGETLVCGAKITGIPAFHDECEGAKRGKNMLFVIEKDGVSWFETQFFMPAGMVEEATQRDGLPYRIYAERGLLTISGENTVDYHDVHEWFRKLEREYEILPIKVGYDRYSAAYLVQDMEADGFSMESVSQGSNLTGVLIDMEGMIKDGRLRCMSDNDLMKVHMLDSALKLEDGTNRRRLVKISAKQHIDGMAALSDAICMRHNYYEEMAAQLSNER
jgi:hypothetical protein